MMCRSRGGGKRGEEINEGRDYAGKCMGKRKGGGGDGISSPFSSSSSSSPIIPKTRGKCGKNISIGAKIHACIQKATEKWHFALEIRKKGGETLFLNVSLSLAAGAENAILHGGFLLFLPSPPCETGKGNDFSGDTRPTDSRKQSETPTSSPTH